MAASKQDREATTDKRTQKREPELRIATLLRMEAVPVVETEGFLAGTGLRPTDRLTRTVLVKRLQAWRNQKSGRKQR